MNTNTVISRSGKYSNQPQRLASENTTLIVAKNIGVATVGGKPDLGYLKTLKPNQDIRFFSSTTIKHQSPKRKPYSGQKFPTRTRSPKTRLSIIMRKKRPNKKSWFPMIVE